MKYYLAFIQTFIAIAISWTAFEIRSAGIPNITVEVPAPVIEKVEVIANVPAPTNSDSRSQSACTSNKYSRCSRSNTTI